MRELRLIAQHKPPYNRRSKFPERSVWVKLTVEPFPRLSIVRGVKADKAATSVRSPRPAQPSSPSPRSTRRSRSASAARGCIRGVRSPACVLAEMGRCGAPCDGRESVDEYAAHVAAVRDAIESDARSVVKTLLRRIETLAAMLRYEDAAAQRDRLAAFIRAAARGQRLSALAGCAQLVAADRRPETATRWSSCGTAGSRRPAPSRRVRRRDPTSTR